jgi:hypothetical protein
MLSSCSLNGEILALILFTVWRNLCSLPAHCMEKYLLSSCSLYGVFLLSPCTQYGGIPALTLLTVWRNSALTLLTVWRNPCSHPARCMEESLNHFNQLKRAGAQQGFLFSYFKGDFPLVWVCWCWVSIWWTLLKFAMTQNL